MAVSLQRLFARYTGFLRTVKGAYVINNLLNAAKLRHNRSLYRKMGLNKSIFSPISHADFRSRTKMEGPWLDQPGALEKLEKNEEFKQFSPEIQAKIRQFVTDGYFVLEQFVPHNETDALVAEVDNLLESGAAGFNFTGRKIFNLFETSALANERFFRRAELIRMLEFLMGKKIIPFQSLNFTRGSEQRAHSDAIHMTTEPEGFMIAAWYALEDCTEHNGPLVYYPGSHRLPFVDTQTYPSGDSTFLIGADSNARYEDKIEAIIAQQQLKPSRFLARKGDVLVWHYNLIHAGSPITGTQPDGTPLTRKSMVCHYFTEEVICYHEMLHRPALIKK